MDPNDEEPLGEGESPSPLPAEEGASDATPPAKKKKRRKKKKAGGGAAGIGKSGEENALKQARDWLAALSVKDIVRKDLFEEKEQASVFEGFRSHQPFPACSITGFLDEQYCEKLAEELEHLDYRKKKNDLYEFVQSDDLKEVTLPLVAKFKEVLYSPEFREVLSNMTGVQVSGLEDSVSVSAAVYQDTHRLLCHDDELSGRRIASILYLVPKDWSAADGGALDLFDVDE